MFLLAKDEKNMPVKEDGIKFWTAIIDVPHKYY
jgi:hypothetical protein